MKINPFNRPDDPLKIQLDATKEMQREELAGRSTGVDEHWAMENQKERAELTRWQQDMSEEIQLMVHRLKNEMQLENGEWQQMDLEPMCSDECVWRLVAMLEPATSKNLMMSKYDKESILAALLDLCDAAALHIISNRKRYKIKMSDLTPLMEIFKTAATPTFFRALGGNEKEYLKGIRKDTYLHTRGDESEQKKGLLGV